MFQKTSGIGKLSALEGSVVFFLENFLFRSAEKKLGETFCVSKSFWYGLKCMDIRARGYHDFLSKNFCLHSGEKLHRGNLLCFKNFLLRKKCMDKRAKRNQDFSSQIFCLTVLKKFVGSTSAFQKISGIGKNFAFEGGVLIFP